MRTLLCWFLPLALGAVQPIVIVPGLGGSVLEASISNRSRYRDCATDSQDYFTLWFSQTQVAWRFDCFLAGISMDHGDDGSPAAVNASGVDIRPRDFGGVDGVEYSNAGAHDLIPMPYMHELITSLEDVGYERGKSLRAATYDFRAAGLNQTLEWQFAQLRGLIENTSHINQNQPVHLVSHSLGGPYANLFLTSYVSAEWKQQFIESHMMFSPPLAGTPVALEALIIGPQYDFVPSFLPAIVVPALRTFPSMVWMSPLLSVTQASSVWRDKLLVQTPTANYTAADYRQLFSAMNASILVDSLDSIATTTAMTANPPGGESAYCM